ncbi:MAG: hypothetical protein JSW00_12185 [Thermoplasmata archaeon]|nr:MAG: hypothetical protein JSW00_12185 [Thermoplasmata archaeon]
MTKRRERKDNNTIFQLKLSRTSPLTFLGSDMAGAEVGRDDINTNKKRR